MHKLIFTLIAVSSISLKAQKIEQQVINSSGSNFSNNGITVTSNVGQTVIALLSSNNNIVTQGFLQPIKSDLPTALLEFAKLDDGFDVFPNPTNGNVSLSFKDASTSLTRVDVYGSDGRLVISSNPKTEVDLTALSDGIYWVRPISENKSFGLKKLIKTH